MILVNLNMHHNNLQWWVKTIELRQYRITSKVTCEENQSLSILNPGMFRWRIKLQTLVYCQIEYICKNPKTTIIKAEI